MARLYANENFPLQTVQELRRLGHDVLTSLEAGNSNRAVPDEEVLAFAGGELRLHRRGAIAHAGIVICTTTPTSSGWPHASMNSY